MFDPETTEERRAQLLLGREVTIMWPYKRLGIKSAGIYEDTFTVRAHRRYDAESEVLQFFAVDGGHRTVRRGDVVEIK